MRHFFIIIVLMLFSQMGYAQIIRKDVGINPMKMPPPTGTFSPLKPEEKQMQTKIEHDKIQVGNKHTLSNGRQEVEIDYESLADSVNAQSSYSIDVIPTDEDFESVQGFFGTLRIVSVSVDQNATRVVLEAKNFKDAKWFVISKRTTMVGHETNRRYPLFSIVDGIGLPESFALNLTQFKYNKITLVFPPLEPEVTVIDIILPYPNKADLEFLDIGKDELEN